MGVQFYFIYKSLAHPELNGYVRPVSMEERLLHLQEAKRTLGSSFTWLADGMDNSFKHAMGDAPNSEWVIDPDGNVVVGRRWSDPAALRTELERFVGAPATTTSANDITMKTAPPPKVAPSGVVPRVEREGSWTPVVAAPLTLLERHESPVDLPTVYVKLRAEAGPGLLNGGSGDLYLRFMCDPIYGVHWNNLVDPIEVTLKGSRGLSVTPTTLRGPTIKEPTDVDPREFIIAIEGAEADADQWITLTVRYFACNDAEGWCRPVTQLYSVKLERDRNAGRVMGNQMMRRMRQMREGRQGRASRRPREGDAPRRVRRVTPPVASATDPSVVLGDWKIAVALGERTMQASLTIESDENGVLSGMYSPTNGTPAAVREITWTDGVLRFVRDVRGREMSFEGQLIDGQLTGTINTGGRSALGWSGKREG